jgi:hypothetical protein
MSLTITISLCIGIEDRAVDHVLDALAVALGQEFKRARRAFRRFRETLPLPILADGVEEFVEDTLQSGHAIFAQTVTVDR